jgi:hypothetical protein
MCSQEGQQKVPVLAGLSVVLSSCHRFFLLKNPPCGGIFLFADCNYFDIVLTHLVQTFFLVPPIFLVCKLMLNFRRVLTLEWLTWCPVDAPRPQTEHTLLIMKVYSCLVTEFRLS